MSSSSSYYYYYSSLHENQKDESQKYPWLSNVIALDLYNTVCQGAGSRLVEARVKQEDCSGKIVLLMKFHLRQQNTANCGNGTSLQHHDDVNTDDDDDEKIKYVHNLVTNLFGLENHCMCPSKHLLRTYVDYKELDDNLSQPEPVYSMVFHLTPNPPIRPLVHTKTPSPLQWE